MEPHCYPFHDSWAFALPCLSKRATLIQRQYNVKSHATFKMTKKMRVNANIYSI